MSMNVQQRAFAAIFEPEPTSEYAKQQAQSTTTARACRPDYVNERRSPLPAVRQIDAALHQKYGARGYLGTRR